tara:strand:+ start:2007 stop:2198 length:192 start_codon:yes stop_codon:yes gene_type:complete
MAIPWLSHGKEKKMEATKIELLQAWMTLVKVINHEKVDTFHSQILPDVLDLLDDLQRNKNDKL